MGDKESLTVGWYGKIPSLGDFVSRRLPSSFIDIWDTWLQKAMAKSREQLGEYWLDLYLTSPIWRFILMPDTCGNAKVWTGILMPSVDKVGRHFPLTIATEIEPYPGVMLSIFAMQDWYATLEQVALASLDFNISPDDLDLSLSCHPLPIFSGANSPFYGQELGDWWQASSPKDNSHQSLSLPTADSLIEVFNEASQDVFSKIGLGKSIWWKVDFETDKTQLHCFTGLPAENKFAILLNNVAQ
ncbi:MAG: type VI secretion system-associated protein TagF [Proteobacteria bacterium]|nr:type VI secretion system-associated protein TagF [Pseudomonadota bacterium]